MKLSVVVPCYNERETIDEIIAAIRRSDYPDKEIVVVDDGSTDGTREKLKSEIEPSGQVEKVIYHDRNQGKGAALRTGFRHATGDIVIVQDADLEYDPDDYGKLLEPIIENKADGVYGSRFIGEPPRVLYFWHTLGNKFLTAMSNMFTNLNLTDMEVCYKVFRRDVLKRITLRCDRFGFEPEVTAKIAKLRPRLRIYEVGVAYHGRSYEEGKKITWKDGVKAILAIVRFRFSD